MAEVSRYGVLCRAGLRLEYLHANSTTHDFLFGAVAELMDNSRDAGATRLDIYTVNNENLQGGFTLCFLDDGCGMTPREATDLVYFGRSSKWTNPKMIGRYGNGLKSGSMRIGKDLILFTKKENTMTCLLFSQTFCETEGLNEVIVPIPSWSSNTRNPIIDDPEKFATQLYIICKYSPFKNEAELMKQFDAIYGETGTLLVIYNVKLTLNGEPELDVLTDEMDMLIAETSEDLPEQQSLRAYTAILYFDPRMRIFIQAKKVETKRLPYCFYRPRMYPYISSSFKQVATNELKRAEMEVKAAEDTVKEAKCTLQQLMESLLHEDSEFAQLALQDALEKEKRMREKLEDKKRNLRRPKKLFIMFGINIQNRSQDGMLIYSNNRLIKMFERVGPQKNMESYFGAGAVGIVDVPLESMEPTHNKQAFASITEYNHLLKAMGCYLVQYWKDIGISQKGETLFWNDFGYLSGKWYERPSETIQYRRRRAVEIPDIVQCVINKCPHPKRKDVQMAGGHQDICLKWRLLSLDTDISHGGHHGIWNCSKSPNPIENRFKCLMPVSMLLPPTLERDWWYMCNVPEHLPSIPLGTFNPTQSLNNKQKLLIDSIRERKRKLENRQSKLSLIQPHKVVPHTVDSRTSAKDNENVRKMVCQQKIFHKDPSPACRCLIKSRTDKGRIQHLSHQKQPRAKEKTRSRRLQHPCQEEKYFLSVPEDRKCQDMPMVLPFEIQDEHPHQEELEVIKTERDSKPEIICIIISDSEDEDLPKYEECNDFSFMHKEKQEQCDEEEGHLLDLASCVKLEKKDLPPTDLESGSAGTSQEDKEQVLVAAQQSNTAVSHKRENSQSIPEAKMIETLTSRIKEILLYFLPECSLSREHLTSMGPEDILSMFKLKGHSEQNEAVTLHINQYFSQYEVQLSKKLQSMEQHGIETISNIETEITLCEVQIKAVQERLEHLRGEIAQLLLKIHPHLLINNLEDIDSFLEEIMKCENLSTFVHENTNTTEIRGPAFLDEEIGK